MKIPLQNFFICRDAFFLLRKYINVPTLLTTRSSYNNLYAYFIYVIIFLKGYTCAKFISAKISPNYKQILYAPDAFFLLSK